MVNIKELNSLSSKYKIEKTLLKSLIKWFGLFETEKILTMKPNDLNKTIRVNLLKVSRDEALNRLREEGILTEPIPLIPEGLMIINGWKKVGSSQSYLNGEIMPQGLGSMMTVHALNPQKGEKILDMAAAPGGKSCFISERMNNEGILYANDKSKSRIQGLINNLSRHSIENVVVTVQDGNKIKEKEFDRILLDAPCTGEGLIVSNITRRQSKSIINHYDLQKVQINLLKRAISLLKVNGICVYSTCSLSPIENEDVIMNVMNTVEIIDTDIYGDPGIQSIHPNFQLTRRLIPSKYKCDGFYIAKLRRVK